MAHDSKTIKTQRVVPVELLYDNHAQEGVEFSVGDTIEANGRHYYIVRAERTQGPFHLRLADSGLTRRLYAAEAHGAVYRPPHPSMTADDVEGATYAYDDGTHWHFAHCSPQEQIDFAADAEQFAFNEFLEYILKINMDAIQATSLDLRTAALYKAKDVKVFARAVGRHVHATVVGQVLGHYHKDPHHDHRRDLTIASLDAVLAKWKEEAKTDDDKRLAVTRIANAVLHVKTRLSSTHKIEWRAAREARLKEEAIASGKDPVDGREYVFTLRANNQPITGAENLPDPNWVFDDPGLVGGVIRGTQVYKDAKPTPTPEKPYIVEFSRPVPANARPLSSIGSVAWEQEAAYKAGS